MRLTTKSCREQSRDIGIIILELFSSQSVARVSYAMRIPLTALSVAMRAAQLFILTIILVTKFNHEIIISLLTVVH